MTPRGKGGGEGLTREGKNMTRAFYFEFGVEKWKKAERGEREGKEGGEAS